MEIITNKQFKTYNYLSRYASFPFYYHKEDRKYVYGTTSQLKQTAAHTLHKVEVNETLDSIALKYYNNPTFFWIIADFNQIQDPYKELEVGTQLKIPTLNEISYVE